MREMLAREVGPRRHAAMLVPHERHLDVVVVGHARPLANLAQESSQALLTMVDVEAAPVVAIAAVDIPIRAHCGLQKR